MGSSAGASPTDPTHSKTAAGQRPASPSQRCTQRARPKGSVSTSPPLSALVRPAPASRTQGQTPQPLLQVPRPLVTSWGNAAASCVHTGPVHPACTLLSATGTQGKTSPDPVTPSSCRGTGHRRACPTRCPLLGAGPPAAPGGRQCHNEATSHRGPGQVGGPVLTPSRGRPPAAPLPGEGPQARRGLRPSRPLARQP